MVNLLACVGGAVVAAVVRTTTNTKKSHFDHNFFVVVGLHG